MGSEEDMSAMRLYLRPEHTREYVLLGWAGENLATLKIKTQGFH